MKTCTKCGIQKDLQEFYKSCKGRDGYQSTCKPCHKQWYEDKKASDPDYVRNVKYKSRYGITVEDYDKMFEEQGGVCYICQQSADRLHVDHCHRSGDIRRLLCHHCNNGLGCFKDNPELLQQAINYLVAR
jgi:hypothetical protein